MEAFAKSKEKPETTGERHVYFLKLISFCEQLKIPREKFLKYKEDHYLLEGVIVAGIQELQARLQRCNTAYKVLQRKNHVLAQFDIRNKLDEEKEKLL